MLQPNSMPVKTLQVHLSLEAGMIQYVQSDTKGSFAVFVLVK